MKADRRPSAPLPVPVQVALVIVGGLLVRAAFELTHSASTATFVGAVLLLVLVGLQRRRAKNGTVQALTTWEQIPSGAVLVALAIGALTVVVAGLLRATVDEGWAAVAVFVGAVSIADCLVRAGARGPTTGPTLRDVAERH